MAAPSSLRAHQVAAGGPRSRSSQEKVDASQHASSAPAADLGCTRQAVLSALSEPSRRKQSHALDADTRHGCRPPRQLGAQPAAFREPLPCRLRLAADAVLSVRDFSLNDAPSSPTDSSLRHYPVPAVISEQRTQGPSRSGVETQARTVCVASA